MRSLIKYVRLVITRTINAIEIKILLCIRFNAHMLTVRPYDGMIGGQYITRVYDAKVMSA